MILICQGILYTTPLARTSPSVAIAGIDQPVINTSEIDKQDILFFVIIFSFIRYDNLKSSRLRSPHPFHLVERQERKLFRPAAAIPSHSVGESFFFGLLRSLALVPPTMSYCEESAPKIPLTTDRAYTM